MRIERRLVLNTGGILAGLPKKALICVALGSVLLGVALASPGRALAGSEVFVTTQLTSNNKNDTDPQVSGDRVVWQSYDGTNYEIYTWTPAGGTTRLATSSHPLTGPQVSGDRVVWYGSDGHDDEIFTWTSSSGPVQVTNNNTRDDAPQVSGDRIVWRGNDINNYYSYVFTWTPTGGVVPITSAGSCNDGPLISNGRVVWAGDSGLFTWTPAGGKVKLGDGGEWLDISGDRVVWDDVVGGGTNMSSEIFTWTPADGVKRITTNSYVDNFPRVSGDRIAWNGTGAADWEAFTWTPASGVVQLTSDNYNDLEPKVSGNRVVWERRPLSPLGAAGEIMMWTPAAGKVPVTSNNLKDSAPEVSGNRIVWMRYDGHDWEIYTALAVPVTVPAITSISPASGPVTGGTTVTITGSGFLGLSGASAVKFGGVNARSYTVNSPTKITAVAPAHATGKVNVVVQALGGTSATTGTGNDYIYANRYEQTDFRLVSTGIWSTSMAASASGGSFGYVDATATTRANFNGTYLAWIAKKSPAYGIARVTLDGTRTFLVDLYSSSTLYKQRVWNTGVLPLGLHTVKIEWTGNKNASAGDANVSVDAFDVAGTLASSTPYDQTNAAFSWTGTWKPVTNTACYGGSFKFANTPGAVATIHFSGVSLTLVAKMSPVYGKARITLDGTRAFTVNLYNATTRYRQKVWSSGFLIPGSHTVKIEWTGERRTEATDTNIDIDAVEVVGTVT